MEKELANHLIAQRFRGFYPVVIDVETGGLEPKKDALLELAAFTIDCDKNGQLLVGDKIHFHVEPFKGANIQPESLAITGIDPHHPFRFAVPEQKALTETFEFMKKKQKLAKCNRCVLVGHNAWFDLHFILAATNRCRLAKKNPLHSFTSFDTATLSALSYGQTVLAQALQVAEISFDQEKSHSAVYDAQKTAELFCKIVNQQKWTFK